ncbi:MAG: hypothetical protein JSV57_00990 [Candidatus Bathyarchaeota archaeon]|nr:MAG: hypothetical protein JSV57_00990 [Candidatus Bathyarchaeota archaeon]
MDKKPLIHSFVKTKENADIRIASTMKYTQLIDFDQAEEFTCRVVKTLDGAKELVEAGFEYVTGMDDAKLFRKRK